MILTRLQCQWNLFHGLSWSASSRLSSWSIWSCCRCRCSPVPLGRPWRRRSLIGRQRQRRRWCCCCPRLLLFDNFRLFVEVECCQILNGGRTWLIEKGGKVEGARMEGGGLKYPHLFKPIFYFCTASFRLRFEHLITTEQRTYPPSNFYTRQPKFDKVWTRIPPFSDPLCASATELAPEMAESFSGVNCVFASIRWCQIKREKTLRGSNWHSTTWSPSRVEHATNVVAKVL